MAPFYSVLIRVNPQNPSSTTDFVCDLCTEMPTPTDGGKTYTFKIRDNVKWHDGSPLTAADVAQSWNFIVLPARRRHQRPRSSITRWSTRSRAPDPKTVVFRLKFATDGIPAVARRPVRFIYKKESSTRIRTGTRRTCWAPGPFKFAGYEIGQSIKGERNPDYYHEGQPYLDGFVGIYAESRRPGSMRSAPIAPRSSSAASRPRPATSWSRSSATRSRCRKATGTAAT